MIKPQNYINILGWMNYIGISSLAEREAYALIYGFSQDGKTEHDLSFSYIADWLMCSRRNAINIIKSLESKGLIQKRQYLINGVIENRYIAIVPNDDENSSLVKSIHRGSENISPVVGEEISSGSENVSPNNTIINNNLKDSNSLTSNPITPIKIENNNNTKKDKRKSVDLSFVHLAENAAYKDALIKWFEYKKSIGDMYKTDTGAKQALADLKKACGTDCSLALPIVEYCIGKEWKGIYDCKRNLQINGTSTTISGYPTERTEHGNRYSRMFSNLESGGLNT